MKVTVFDLGQVQRKFWGFNMLWGLPEWTFLKRVHCEVWTMDLWQSTLESIVFFCNKKSACQALLQGQAASAGCFWTFHFWNRWSREVILRLNAFERLVDYPWKIGLFEQLGLFLRHLGCQIDTNDIKDLGKVVLEKGQQGVGSAWREVDVKSVGWKQWAKPSQNITLTVGINQVNWVNDYQLTACCFSSLV